MRRTELLDQLVEEAKKVFDRVELVNGDFRGGICRVRNERCLFLNRNASLDTNLRVAANALASEDLDQRYLLPAIREAIEKLADR